MKFSKLCYSCGNKVQKLFDGKCETCIKTDHPPIEFIKPMKFKIDNLSKKISYNNIYYTRDEIENLLPQVIKKYVVINENYILKEVEIENFDIAGNTLSFDVTVDCDLK